jgi:EmrB/QacA subfamily drug resistance transporter
MDSPYSSDDASRRSELSAGRLGQSPWPRAAASMAGVLLALLLAALDQTIVATAMPSIVADLGRFDQFAWVFSCYMLASTTSIPIMGKLSDMYGRKWVLVAGVFIFLAGSALCGSAQNMVQLILFRGVQGVGAGSIIGNSYAVLGDVSTPMHRGRWMGFVGGVFAVAVVLGPLAGGFITDHASWRWIFFLNIPLGLLALLIILAGMANVRDPEVTRSLDLFGLVALIASVVPLLLALTLGGKEYPWASSQVVGLLAVSAVMGLVFLWAERRAREPLIPGALFANPIFTVAIVVTFLTSISAYAGIMFIPLFVQGVIGSSATSAGVTLMPALLSVVVSGVVAGQIISQTGNYRIMAVGGTFVMAAGVFLFTRLDAQSSNADALVYMVVAGVGVGATLPTLMVSVQNAFSHHMLGVATASLQFFRSIGGAVGTGVLGSFMTARLATSVEGPAALEAAKSLPAEVVAELRDPQVLLDPGTMARLGEAAGQGEGGATLAVLVEGLRGSLASAMHDVFLLGLGVTAVAAVVSLFLRQIPLQKSIQAGSNLEKGGPD